MKLRIKWLSTFWMLLFIHPVIGWTQPIDGTWSGTLKCSENLINRNPAYSIDFDLQVTGTTGHGERTDAQSIERFSMQQQPSGVIELQSTGRLRSDTSPRWTTRFTGRALDSDKLELNGQMFGADGRTLVRERCSVVLLRSTTGVANTFPTINYEESPNAKKSGFDHRNFKIREVTPKSRPLSTQATSSGLGGLPRGEGDALYLPEDWLTGTGQPWHFRTVPTRSALPVPVRSPDADEKKVIAKAQALMQRLESRAMVLLDDGEIVEVISTGGIQFDTLLLSASMAKTVTALATGKAICAGRLSMDKRADSVVAALAGTDLGAATLRDLLMMASGTTEPSARDYVGTTPEETRQYLEGSGNLEQLLATPRQSTAQKGVFSKLRPGERFSYKSRDPYTVAMMLERAVGMPATRWIDQQLLSEARTEYPAILATDRSGYFHGANGGVRLALIDWIRLAIYVDEQRRTETCFGRFIKEMGKTQIRASGVTKGFDGYGYLTWTDNSYAPNSFWAVGYGGQRIGWSTDPHNRRIFLMFSNSADRDMDHVYPVAREWFTLGQKR